jgi:alpha-amylase
MRTLNYLELMAFPTLSWVHQTNVYEVNLRQYTPEGTFKAFMQHIPRLKDMGVHTLWLMPVTPISVYNRKGSLGSYYACSDYRSINPEFGTIDDFKALVQLAHQMGMKLIIDWVANHTGADHLWTREHPDFYHHNEHGEFFDKNGWDDVYDLNYNHRPLRDEMIACMNFWVRETDIDGFRCDMAMLTPVDFWYEARLAVDKEKRLFWLAECDQWNDPAYLEVFDAAYTWKWMRVTEDYYKQSCPIHSLIDTLYGYNSLKPGNAIRAWFTSNHDENSWNGTEYEKYGDMARAMAVFSCTWNGIPLLYNGQEIPNLKRLSFFEKDAIDWGFESSLHDFYKKLLGLQHVHPALIAAVEKVQTQFIQTDHQDKVIAYLRKNGESELIVLLNLSPYPLALSVYDQDIRGNFNELFTDKKWNADQEKMVQLEAWGYMVWVKSQDPV